jgi:hypothetical protein
VGHASLNKQPSVEAQGTGGDCIPDFLLEGLRRGLCELKVALSSGRQSSQECCLVKALWLAASPAG